MTEDLLEGEKKHFFLIQDLAAIQFVCDQATLVELNNMLCRGTT